MDKEITKKFVENTGFICTNCGSVIVDGHKHDNQEDLCDKCKITDLEAKLAEKDKELKRLHKNWRNSQIQQRRLYDNVKQQVVEQNKELKNKYPFLKKYDNGIFVEYNVVYEREGLVNTICFGKNKEMAEHTLKTLMEEK